MNEPLDVLNAIPELEKETPATQFMVQDFWIPVAWGVGIAVLLATVGLLIWLKTRKKKIQLPPTPEELALAELERIEREAPGLRECSLRISMALRRFLTGRTQDPALFETHEEFSQRMDALSSIPKSCQHDTRLLLEKLAGFKYAGQQQNDPALSLSLTMQARDLINRISEAQRQEAAAAEELARMQKKMP